MKTRLQRIWGNMKDRCTNPNNPEKWYAPKNQGRRGIPRKKVSDGKCK